MLMDRIIGAFTFRKGVYADVEKDSSFTQTAWILVAVIAFLSQLGSKARVGVSISDWLIGSIAGTVAALIGFAIAALIISWVGRAVFNAEVTFDELVRTLGLAYIWNVVGFLGILGFISGLNCLVGPIIFLAWILGLVAWFIAAKEALDLEWLQTIVTVFLGWIAWFIIMLITNAILGLIGITASSIFGL
ncbi:MAG: hypothetical protein U9R58_15895 [Chloroflexota bacterium]|nr:hypothetical protein [Chloroflexota bacterium]